MSSPWWAGLGPVETELECGAGTHRLCWEAGQLIAVDHPDIEGELVLGALGGTEAICVTLVEAWKAHCDDLRVLALGPRGPRDQLTLSGADVEAACKGSGGSVVTAKPGQSRSRMKRRAIGSSPLVRQYEASRARRVELLSLLALGGPFQERLAGMVVDAWVARMAEDEGGKDGSEKASSTYASAESTLIAALAGRVAPVVGAWLGIDPDQVGVSAFGGAGWGQVGTPGPGSNQLVSVELRLDWLSRVWAPRMAVVDSFLVVAVEDAAWPEATVLAFAGPGQAPERIALRFEEQAWKVRQSGGGSGQDR